MFYFVGVSSDLGRALNSSNMKFDSPKRWKMLFLQTSNKERASLQSNSLKKKQKQKQKQKKKPQQSIHSSDLMYGWP